MARTKWLASTATAEQAANTGTQRAPFACCQSANPSSCSGADDATRAQLEYQKDGDDNLCRVGQNNVAAMKHSLLHHPFYPICLKYQTMFLQQGLERVSGKGLPN